MIVFCNHNAAVNALPEHVRRRTRHLPRRLADCGEHNAPCRECVPCECLFHRRIGQNLCQGLLDDAVCIAPQIHDDPSFSSELRARHPFSFLL